MTGSVAAGLAPTLAVAVRLLWGAEVRAIATAAAMTFVTEPALALATGHSVVGPQSGGALEGRVEHMELAQWAELVLVAPATANTIAVLAHGLAGDPLSTCLLAADAPVVLAPSMNPGMWRNPRVQRNVRSLEADGVGIVPPVEGTAMVDLAVGVGAMPAAPLLVQWVLRWLADRGADGRADDADREPERSAQDRVDLATGSSTGNRATTR